MDYLLLFVIFIVVIVLAAKAAKILRPYEKGVVERLGKYQRTVESGLVIIVPFIETIRKVDLREQVVDVPPQEVITKDNTVVIVDCVIFYEVVDPFNAVYNVVNFYQAITKLAQTNLRNIVGDLELDQTLTSREMINTHLREVLDGATDKWGTRVVRVEIQRIEPPKDIVDAMSKQMKAERMKRASILEAEGYKQSEIKRAEGDKQAAILESEGQAEAIKKVADANKYQEIAIAEGEATANVSVYQSIHEGNPTNDLIAIKYLEALEKIADGNSTKIFLPAEVSGILGSIGGISELFGEDNLNKKVIPKEVKKERIITPPTAE
ncbi:SPFH domain-containing protein [Methanobrevibacter filiformis]|uniref:Modulator of FtsH protease HflK n=1 Tax=Methanobrevibacter filiformis TaxID=55758 RepID=A0A166CVS2_9EURY|nr:SPFH domain-containing protein [Methanobrevibacter filiformis]KZX17167.1 modulator of FtsH protease HflK [Methanobrevibacter filiformis]